MHRSDTWTYIYSAYFMAQTMSPVGTGDIVPTDNAGSRKPTLFGDSRMQHCMRDVAFIYSRELVLLVFAIRVEVRGARSLRVFVFRLLGLLLGRADPRGIRPVQPRQ